MGTMAARAVPILVGDGVFLFLRDFKPVPSFMAMGAQFLHALHLGHAFLGLVPVRDARPVRIPHRFMADRRN